MSPLFSSHSVSVYMASDCTPAFHAVQQQQQQPFSQSVSQSIHVMYQSAGLQNRKESKDSAAVPSKKICEKPKNGEKERRRRRGQSRRAGTSIERRRRRRRKSHQHIKIRPRKNSNTERQCHRDQTFKGG